MEAEKETDDGNPKKARLFSAKAFRENLKSNEKLYALQEFANLCLSSEKHQYILEYFEANGSCVEILETLEGESNIPQAIVFEILTHLILEVSSNYPQLQRNTLDACKYLLANFMQLINKMLGLSSRERERRVVLKLLTAVVTVSSSLAKDVLMQVNFNPMNLEVLTKHTGGRDSVRSALIHFIAAFLVDNHYPTISALLQKHLLLTSVIKGLQYDGADSVCVILTTLKNHVLENSLFPKTIKMQTFSTPVIKDIVNLYNWRGPEGYNSKKQNASFKVNEYDKSKVSECTHNFLLVLCTSHKFGVIFRDHSVGLSKVPQNRLIYTVLDSLERPWEHSYAGELVVKICAACPELTRIIWGNLKPFLEPRPTDKWLKAMQFARNLLRELQPSCIEYCVKELTVNQLAQVTQMLIAPSQILKQLLSENCPIENFTIKHPVIQLQLDVLKSLETYAAFGAKRLSPENLQVYRSLLAKHVSKNFPSAPDVIANWQDESKYIEITSFKTPTVLDYLSACFDLFDLYETYCISLLDDLSTSVDLHQMLSREEKFSSLQVKMLKLFMCLDQTVFFPNNPTFTYVLPLTLEFYYETKNELAHTVLTKLLRNTDIFEGSEAEINVWINSVFEVKHFDRSIGELLANSVSLTSKKNIEYLTRLSTLEEKRSSLSPLILGVLECLPEDGSKSVNSYLNHALVNLLHLQSDSRVLVSIFNETQGFFSRHVLKYLMSWEHVGDLSLLKMKGKLNLLPQFSEAFRENTVDSFVVNHAGAIVEEQQVECLFHASLFWLINFARVDQLSLLQVQNCLAFIKQEATSTLACARVILARDPIFTQYFSPSRLHEASTRGSCTYFITEIVRHYKAMNFFLDLEPLLKIYRAKLFGTLTKAGVKKFNDVFEVLEVFDLDLEQVYALLENITKSEASVDTNGLQKLLVYCLQQVCNDGSHSRPLDAELVASIAKILGSLIEQNDTNELALVFAKYLNLYPHCFEFVGDELFESICTKSSTSKENTNALAALLFSKKPSSLKEFIVKHLDVISSRKGLTLSLIEVAIAREVEHEFLVKVYEAFAPSIIKAVQKPQKAGQHFEKHFEAVGVLLKQFLPVDQCEAYVRTVQKYDVSATFHAHLIEVIFDKVIFKGENYNENFLNNSVLTFIHYCVNLLKKKHDPAVLEGVVKHFDRFLQKICANSNTTLISYEQVGKSEVFKTFCKFCLKFGLSGSEGLLKLLCALLKFVDVGLDNANLLMDMILSHSEFLEVVLSENHRCKTEILAVIGELCQKWEGVMQRDHVPIFLAAYSATLRPSDRIILSLLRRYESQPAQTFFFDFKPFLWGPSAASHYSVRSDVRRALWRQPKMRDVLENLRETHVMTTIKHHRLTMGLNDTDVISKDRAQFIYDLTFLLPLFTLLLAPENVVHTNKFMKSGAFSLTIIGLSNDDKNVRAAACVVLSRFYHHLEVSHHNKDSALLLRFVEAICKGTSVQDDFKLNNFASIFLARMALILTNPTHVMYVPLSQYLGAKDTLNFTFIPELYTLLHSADVNFKLHRNFILEVLRDGLRTENDFDVLLRSMSLKLIMELFTSNLSDVEAQLLILEILKGALRLPRGVKFLCSSYGLLSWLHQVVLQLEVPQRNLLPIIIDLLHEVAKTFTSNDFNCSLLALTLSHLINRIGFYELGNNVLIELLKSVALLCNHFQEFLTEESLRGLISFVRDKECEYLLKYGGKYVDFDFDEENSSVQYYVKFITLKYVKSNR